MYKGHVHVTQRLINVRRHFALDLLSRIEADLDLHVIADPELDL